MLIVQLVTACTMFALVIASLTTSEQGAESE